MKKIRQNRWLISFYLIFMAIAITSKINFYLFLFSLAIALIHAAIILIKLRRIIKSKEK